MNCKEVACPLFELCDCVEGEELSGDTLSEKEEGETRRQCIALTTMNSEKMSKDTWRALGRVMRMRSRDCIFTDRVMQVADELDSKFQLDTRLD